MNLFSQILSYKSRRPVYFSCESHCHDEQYQQCLGYHEKCEWTSEIFFLLLKTDCQTNHVRNVLNQLTLR